MNFSFVHLFNIYYYKNSITECPFCTTFAPTKGQKRENIHYN